MSKEFNILEYLNLNTDWFGKKRNSVPFVMPSFYQNRDDDEGQDGLNNVLRRHLRSNSNPPPIVIRQIRHIAGPIAVRGMWDALPKQDIRPGVVVNAVRPYAKTTRASCYWQDAGWEKRDRYLIGHYSAGGRLFAGSIELTDSVVESGKYYIYNPPVAVLRGEHGPCFRFQGKAAGKRKYWIHFSEEPADIDSGIIQIQRDLSAAIDG